MLVDEDEGVAAAGRPGTPAGCDEESPAE